jgi:hypothetical protein
MMEIGTVKIPAKNIIGGITLGIKIEGLAAMRFRLWLCSKILLLAGKVGGVKIQVDAIHQGDE